MREFTLEKNQVIDRPLEEVFAFFADARNLARITPDWLSFDILSPRPITIAPGTLIDYTIKYRGVPMRWQSEITAWDPPHRFVDEQRKGPYQLWIHEHTFESLGERSTLVRDRVRYGVAGGTLVQKFFVEPDLEKIFAYRAQQLDEYFKRERKMAQ
jgi:ligand-binding SRPBCC domain-containing protein